MIYARSPYIVYDNTANLEDIGFKLYIYTGTKDTDKGTPDYTFLVDAINGEVEFDIAPYIRDFLYSLNDPLSVTSGGRWCWVTTEIAKDTGAGLGSYATYETTQLACLGYTYHDDGVNFTTEPALDNGVGLLSSANKSHTTPREIIKPHGESAILTVRDNTQILGDNQVVDWYPEKNGGGIIISSSTVTSADLDESNDQYTIVTSPSNAKSYVIGRDGFSTWALGYTDRGNITELVCSDNDTIRIEFLNRYGSLDRLYFTGRTIKTENVTRSKYKRSVLSGGTYLVRNHVEVDHQISGKTTWTINSGLYPERYDQMFKEMLQSDRVWYYDADNTQYLPINVRSSSVQYKTAHYDKAINYTIEIEFSFNNINRIK